MVIFHKRMRNISIKKCYKNIVLLFNSLTRRKGINNLVWDTGGDQDDIKNIR